LLGFLRCVLFVLVAPRNRTHNHMAAPTPATPAGVSSPAAAAAGREEGTAVKFALGGLSCCIAALFVLTPPPAPFIYFFAI
jgi:hypothetical protein